MHTNIKVALKPSFNRKLSLLESAAFFLLCISSITLNIQNLDSTDTKIFPISGI